MQRCLKNYKSIACNIRCSSCCNRNAEEICIGKQWVWAMRRLV